METLTSVHTRNLAIRSRSPSKRVCRRRSLRRSLRPASAAGSDAPADSESPATPSFAHCRRVPVPLLLREREYGAPIPARSYRPGPTGAGGIPVRAQSGAPSWATRTGSPFWSARGIAHLVPSGDRDQGHEAPLERQGPGPAQHRSSQLACRQSRWCSPPDIRPIQLPLTSGFAHPHALRRLGRLPGDAPRRCSVLRSLLGRAAQARPARRPAAAYPLRAEPALAGPPRAGVRPGGVRGMGG